MAVGPTLGTGLFIGAGQALAVGGPASLFISYVFLSFLTYLMATAVAEVATHNPSRHGTMVTNGIRYLPSSLGFATASLRWYTLSMFIPYEITTSMVNLGLWTPDSKIALRLTLVTVVIVGFNFLPERHSKISEVILTRIKIGTMACLLILSLSIALGGSTGYKPWGFRYWNNPGAFNEYVAHGGTGRFLALMQCLLYSSIAFTLSPELIVHRAELADTTDQPATTESLESVTYSTIAKQVHYDVLMTTIPYILSALAMGIMAPYNNTLLSNNETGAGLSPFVIGMNTAKIRILPVTVTIAILVSSVASGRSFLNIASHNLCAMSEIGHAPSIFKIRNNWGVPWVAVTFTSTFTTLSFLCAARSSSVMTTYFILFVNSSGYLSSMLSCLVYSRFRGRLNYNGITNAYHSRIQPMGTYVGFIFSGILLMSNGLVAAAPKIGAGSRGTRIIMAYISLPLFLFLYIGHRLQQVVHWRMRSEESSDKSSDEGSVRYFPRQEHDNRPLEPPTVLEFDQVWTMASEV
ncbi:hypothetical protein N7495_000319 [Penicillium taxi]|uniref:uncharacterized protein n=1 Tax=Penicillium taxi TaxID=168475 RepID=UPI0025454795|nr:uncharacterized protein N7495_000319 [Penicillium taxi]KAJ5907637.1 hypothetical protein N7495_000319 [Penicillium taxi]